MVVPGEGREGETVAVSLRAGELAVLLGAAGSGKTVLLRRLAGLAPGPGRLLVDGRELSAAEVAYLHGAGRAGADPARALAVLVDASWRPAGEASAPARAEWLLGLARAGAAVLLACSEPELVPDATECVFLLRRGRLLAAGRPAETLADPRRMAEAGLPLPRLAQLFHQLRREEGWLVEEIPTTVAGARRWLADYRARQGRLWRRGFTTGTAAAAATRAAVRALLEGRLPAEVSVDTPAGRRVTCPVAGGEVGAGWATARVVKDGGDDPDVTSGLAVEARVEVREGAGVRILGGPGVGVVTRPGLAVPPGEPAINPVPRRMIGEAAAAWPGPGLLEVTISVPGGEEVARRTMNPRLGIEGGISILGTSGIVEPMSEEAFRTSLVPQVAQALAAGYRSLVLAPGRAGQELASRRYRLPERAVVLTSNFVGFLLGECARLGAQEVMLFGHVGKLAKVAAGSLHTHSGVGGGALETLAACAAAEGAGAALVRAILAANTSEAAAGLLREAGLGRVLDAVAARASRRAREHCGLPVGTVLTALDGRILGLDNEAERIGEALGWQR